jgi:hypothetical protein
VANEPTILIRDTTTFESGVLANEETGKISGARVWIAYPDDVPGLAMVAAAIVSTDAKSLRSMASALTSAAADLDAALAVQK